MPVDLSDYLFLPVMFPHSPHIMLRHRWWWWSVDFFMVQGWLLWGRINKTNNKAREMAAFHFGNSLWECSLYSPLPLSHIHTSTDIVKEYKQLWLFYGLFLCNWLRQPTTVWLGAFPVKLSAHVHRSCAQLSSVRMECKSMQSAHQKKTRACWAKN